MDVVSPVSIQELRPVGVPVSWIGKQMRGLLVYATQVPMSTVSGEDDGKSNGVTIPI